MQPLVSIVIPCYNGSRFLGEAIESCLKQTHRHIEVIVVDDASPDNCFEIASSFAERDMRVRVVPRSSNGGVSLAFNTGFEIARGEFFTRLAQDDFFFENAIETMLGQFEEKPNVGLVYAPALIVDEAGNVVGEQKIEVPEKALSEHNGVGLCVMWRSAVWQEVGSFDPEFDTAEDYEYWARISRRYEIIDCASDPLLCFRQHPSMGSMRFRPKQLIAAAQVQARYFAPENIRRRIITDAHWEALWACREAGDFRSAWAYAMQCIRRQPGSLLYWKTAIGTTAKLIAGGARGSGRLSALSGNDRLERDKPA